MENVKSEVDLQVMKVSPPTKELPSLPIHSRFSGCLRRQGRRLVYGWWAWEVMAATVSLAAAIALLAVLAQADRRQSQAWFIGNTQLTLNTIVAAIGTVQRAALLLVVTGALNQHMWNWFASKRDADAGRPPSRPFEDLATFSEGSSNLFGCLRLLWRTKGRYVTSLGAMIIILAIAFDAFLQQLIVIRSQSQSRPLSAGDLISSNVLPQVFGLDQDREYEIERDYGISTKLQSIVLSGVYDDSSSVPAATCPTGDCTWPQTPTLAVCSQCHAVGSVKIVASNSSCERIITYTVADEPNRSNRSVTYSTCKGISTTEWELKVANGYGYDSDLWSTIASILIYGSPLTTKVGSIDDSPFAAYRCQFYLCIKGYSAVSTQGKVKQDPSKELANRTHLALDSDQAPWLLFDDLPASLTAYNTTLFNVSYRGFSFLGEPFNNVLDTRQYQSNKSDSVVVSVSQNGTNDTSASNRPADIDYLPPSFWIASSSLANLSAHTERIAESYTSWMRTNWADKGPPDIRYAPVVATQVPTVSVRWVWLIYPLSLQVASLVFLALTMYATSRRNVRPWKGDRIPLLLARLDESIHQRAVGGLANRTGLDDRLAQVRVRLQYDGENDIYFRKV